MEQQKRTALVVEDEPIQALELNEILQSLGYLILGTATSAEEAMSIVSVSPPQLAVIDVGLSSPITGMTLARHLSERYDTRVVLVTGDPAAVIREAPEFGKVLLPKPFFPNELLALLRKVCNHTPRVVSGHGQQRKSKSENAA